MEQQLNMIMQKQSVPLFVLHVCVLIIVTVTVQGRRKKGKPCVCSVMGEVGDVQIKHSVMSVCILSTSKCGPFSLNKKKPST